MKKQLINSFFGVLLITTSWAMEGIQEEKNKNDILSFLFDEKIYCAKESLTVGTGWYDARLITPGTQFYVKCQDGYKLHTQADEAHTLHLYKKSPVQNAIQSPSQSLLKKDGKSVGTSVDTSIHTETNRKKETKQTFIQYDWTKIQEEGKDFNVDSCMLDDKDNIILTARGENRKQSPTTNYDGGHLIDHKFSAQGSHMESANYVPQHHFYNRWLKEHIVKNASGYIEIPLFTSNSPLIKVTDSDKYDAIPVGILLAPLQNFQILDMYYFPNNQFNYRRYQSNLGITSSIAKTMVPHFKIRKELYRLFLPAIIYDLKARHVDLAQQLALEARGTGIIGELIEGMSVLSLDDEEAILSTLASDVIHQTNIKISNILGVSSTSIITMNNGQKNPGALTQAFNVLGQFLVDYAMKNALKSELLSTHSRIMFVNILADFVECHHQVSAQAFDRVDEAYTDIFPATVKELWNIKEQMGITDLIYFSNFYQKLASPFLHFADHEGFKLWKTMDFDKNILKFIKLLKLVHSKADKMHLKTSQMQNLVHLFSEAQHSFSYLITLGWPTEELTQQRAFLKVAKKKVLEWHELSKATAGKYQTSPNSATSFRGLNGISVDYLGTYSSEFYQNDEDNESEEENKTY